MKKILLAYSGGLDTTYCIKYLQQQGWEVHCALVHTGGFTHTELEEVASRADFLGAASFKVLDAQNDYYNEVIKYLVFGNVLRGNTYPLSVSAERNQQAKALAVYAKQIGVSAVAHGSTGAGNDQVRFDLVFSVLAPELEIITPIRDQGLSREAEIAFLKETGVSLNFEKAKYSVNKGLWGTSVGGAETLTSDQALPSAAFPSQPTKSEPEILSLEFLNGELTHVNGEALHPVEAIEKVAALGNAFGIGRDIHVGDTIVGIKGRVGFEAAAATLIIKAHHLLEKHTLSKWQAHWKQQLGDWYGMFLHEAMFLEPVMRNIEVFLEDTQKNVTGTVEIKLYPHRFELMGVKSDFDLMQSRFGAYGEENNSWSAEDAKGFIKMYANALKIQHATTLDGERTRDKI